MGCHFIYRYSYMSICSIQPKKISGFSVCTTGFFPALMGMRYAFKFGKPLLLR